MVMMSPRRCLADLIEIADGAEHELVASGLFLFARSGLLFK